MMAVIRFISDAAFAIWIVGPLLFWAFYKGVQQPERRIWQTLSTLGGVVVLVMSVCVFVTIILDLGREKSSVDRFFEDAVPLTGVALGLGGMLFTLRKADRALYGLAEIGFAALTAGYAAWFPEHGFFPRLLALGAAIYIVVRGLDNVDQGRTSGSSVGVWLNARLSRDNPEQAKGGWEIVETKHASKGSEPEAS